MMNEKCSEDPTIAAQSEIAGEIRRCRDSLTRLATQIDQLADGISPALSEEEPAAPVDAADEPGISSPLGWQIRELHDHAAGLSGHVARLIDRVRL